MSICVGNVFDNAGANLGAKKVGECMEKRGHGGKEMRGKWKIFVMQKATCGT